MFYFILTNLKFSLEYYQILYINFINLIFLGTVKWGILNMFARVEHTAMKKVKIQNYMQLP